MFWDDHITDNLIKVCDCSETVFAAMGINGKVELDRKNNLVRCHYEGAELLQVSREDWKKAYAIIAF